MEVAAEIARKKALQKTGLSSSEIGIIFISPCPSKVSYAKAPLGIEKSNIDNVVAIKEIYPLLLPHMKHEEEADGIVNVLRVLEGLEDEKIHGLKFVELNACSGGCTGGVLTVENPYVAEAKTKKLLRYLPVSRSHLDAYPELDLIWNGRIEYEPVFRLGNTFKESLHMMKAVEDLVRQFPGLDCGSCGAPTCQALAEDIVRGEASVNDCTYVFRDSINHLSDEVGHLSDAISQHSSSESYDPDIYNSIKNLMTELKALNRHNLKKED